MKNMTPDTSEKGSAIVVVLLVLVLLTIFGTTSITTSDVDMKVASGERDYIQDFYVADSAWKEGAAWLGGRGTPPDPINTEDDDVVKNFGDDGEDVMNDDFPEDTEDGTMEETPYWYNLTYEEDHNAPGNGPEYRSFRYEAIANANRTQQINVELSKIYKTGY